MYLFQSKVLSSKATQASLINSFVNFGLLTFALVIYIDIFDHLYLRLAMLEHGLLQHIL